MWLKRSLYLQLSDCVFFKFNIWIMRVTKKDLCFCSDVTATFFFPCILYCKILATHIIQFLWCLIFQEIPMQIAFIPWDGGCWFEHSYLLIYNYVCLECQEVRWKMGALKYIHSAISYPIGACLLLLVRVTIVHFSFSINWVLSLMFRPLILFLNSLRFSFSLWPIWSFLTLPLLVHLRLFIFFSSCLWMYTIIYMWRLPDHSCVIAVHTVYGLYGYLSQHYDWNIQDTKWCIPHRLSFQSFKKGDIDLDEDSLTHTLWLHWLWTEAPMRWISRTVLPQWCALPELIVF